MQVRDSSGQVIAVLPVGMDPEHWFDEQGLDPERHTVEYARDELRSQLRSTIHREVADPESLLGHTADCAAIVLHALAVLIGALPDGPMRDALAPFEPAFAALVERLKEGEVRLPYQVKGDLDQVLSEVTRSGDKVASILAKRGRK